MNSYHFSDVINMVCAIFSAHYGVHVRASSSHLCQPVECKESFEVRLSTFVKNSLTMFLPKIDFRLVAEMWIGYLKLCHNHSVIGLENIPSDGPGKLSN